MALIDDFKTRFPEFADAIVDLWIPILEDVWPCYYGRGYDEGCGKEIVLNLLAHLITIEAATGSESVKSVASQSVGSVSESYVNSSNTGENADFFGSSKYGQRFLFLTARYYAPKFV